MDDPFRGIFIEESEPGDIGDEDIDQQSTQQEDDFYKRAGWILTIDMLAKNDITKWEEVEKINVMRFLNYLSLHKQKNEIEKMKGG